MTSEVYTAEEFASKVDWEGGVFWALEYGLHHENLDPSETELKEAWKALEEAYHNKFELLIEAVQELLDEYE